MSWLETRVVLSTKQTLPCHDANCRYLGGTRGQRQGDKPDDLRSTPDSNNRSRDKTDCLSMYINLSKPLGQRRRTLTK